MASPSSPLPAAVPTSFERPQRHIFDAADHQAFLRSPACEDFLRFVAALNAATAKGGTEVNRFFLRF